MLVEHERIVKVDLQHLGIRSIMRFLIKWKDYPKDEVSWEFFRKIYPCFVIEDIDLLLRGVECNESIGKWIIEKSENLHGRMYNTKDCGWREAGGWGVG